MAIRLLSAALVLLVGVLAFVSAPQAVIASGSGLWPSGTTVRLSPVRRGRIATARLTVWNVRPRRLRVLSEASCGCSAVRPSPSALAPLQKATIEYEIPTSGMPLGAFRRTVKVEVSPPQVRPLVFEVDGLVVP